jgi:SlyX protein
MDDRITELESKLAFSERLIDQLNEVVTEHEKRIKALESAVVMLNDQMQLHGGVSEGKHEKPPHY